MKNEPDESVQDVMEKISRAAGNAAPVGTEHREWVLPEFFRRPSVDVRRNSYHADELLHFRGRDFVTVAYQALLKRDPDPEGMETYTRLLREKPGEKPTVLAALHNSFEGENQGVALQGLGWHRFLIRVKRIPVIGRLPGLFAALTDPFGVKKRIIRLEDRVEEAIGETGRAMEWTVIRVQHRMDAKAERWELENKADQREMERYLLQVGRVLDRVKEMKASASPPDAFPPSADAAGGSFRGADAVADAVTGDVYLSFEDAFRGSREKVRRRMEVYMPMVREAAGRVESLAGGAVLPEGCVALDLGCGRGEFLELLAGAGIRAAGVDANRYAVGRCRDAGLDVHRGDLFGFAESLPAESLAVVTAFHVIEHLEFDAWFRLIGLARRILAPGGMLILETPNPLNILAGSVDFYRDPTHLRPVHPDTLLYMTRASGFARAGAWFLEDAGAGRVCLESTAGGEYRSLQDYVDVARDYALIAYKGRDA